MQVQISSPIQRVCDFRRSPLIDQRGQSIIQVMISIGLVGILLAVFSAMMESQVSETRALNEKLAALDLRQLLTASLADGSVCQYVVSNPTALSFDSTNVFPSNPRTITLPDPDDTHRAALYASILPGPTPGLYHSFSN